MKSGDVFTLDAQSINEVATATKVSVEQVRDKLSDGDTYSIAKSERCDGTLVRASRWVDGKPKKGRPRRFPAATVARLLGESYDAPEEAEETTEAADEADLEAHAAGLLDNAVDAEVAVEGEATSW